MNFDIRKMTSCSLCVSIFLIIGQFQFVESVQCVKRLAGACKVFNVTTEFNGIKLKDFSSPPPEGFLLKTSIEINLRDNLYKYENRSNEETGKRISYANRLDVVTVVIPIQGPDWFSYPEIVIDLGLKNDRMARLSYIDEEYGVDIQKWSTFTPLLPRFPYHLRLEITESLTFSAYADRNDEPFFIFQIEKLSKINPNYYPRYHHIQLIHEGCPIAYTTTPPKTPRYSDKRLCEGFCDRGCAEVQVYGVGFQSRYGQDELVAFVDCSSLFGGQDCGTHHVDNVYNCRRSFDGGDSYLRVPDSNERKHRKIAETLKYDDDEKAYIVFDDTFVLDVKKQFSLTFYFFGNAHVHIDFYPDSISALLFTDYKTFGKKVTTKTLYALPIGPYAVRVRVSYGETNNYFKISNMRGHVILAMRLCFNPTVSQLTITNPVPNYKQKIYFDCDQTSNSTYVQPLVTHTPGDDVFEFISYNEIGYNFTKTLIDTRNFVDEDTPPVLYEDAFGYVSTEDWCDKYQLPKPYVPKTGKHAVVDTEKINQQILAEFKSQNNQTAAAFKAILSELQSIKTWSHGIDMLYGCRESLAENYGWIVLAGNNGQNAFDEFFVVDLTSLPKIHFNYDDAHSVVIEFNLDGIVTKLKTDLGTTIKTVEASKWDQALSTQFSVHVEVFSVNDVSNYMKISNIRDDLILQVKICWNLPLRNLVLATSPNLNKINPIHFDCVHHHGHDLPLETDLRPKKYDEERFGIIYNEDGYNFTEKFTKSRNYGDLKIQPQPAVLYKDMSGHVSTEDWCEGEPLPQLYVPQINEGATLKEIVSELRSIKATIDAQNVTN